MVMGLNTGLWVSAQVRLCDLAFIPATVVPASGSPRRTTVAGMNAMSHSRTCALTHSPVLRPITI